MAGKHLVPCDCGNQVPAAVHQAGSTVACECGKQVQVPQLRKLRQLPLADDQPADVAPGWSARQAATLGGVVVTAGLLLWALYLRSVEPEPLLFPERRHAESVEHMMETATPLWFWQWWRDSRDSLANDGFQEMVSPQAQAIDAYIAERQFLRSVILGIAGAVAVVTILARLFWPVGRTPM